MNKTALTRRRTILLPIIFAVLAVLCVLGLVACSEDVVTEDDIINRGYNIAVVFDYGGGTANEKPSMKIRIQEGSKVPNPASSGNKLKLPGRSGYSFKCYCVAKTDENGEPLRDEGGNLIPDRVWDFDKDIPEGDITLVAQWWQNYKLVLHYGENYELTKKAEEIPRTTDGLPTSTIKSTFLVNGYTFIDYFYDKEESEIIESVPMPLENERFQNSADGLTLDIYGKSLFGTYQVIKKARDLLSFSFTSTTNIYMYTDVDMNDLSANQSFAFPNEYSGEFLGNYKTISNLKISQSSSNNSDFYYGIFKELGSEAKISNITFEDAVLEANLSQPSIQQYTLGMFAGRVRGNAQLTNIHVTGTIDYTVAAGFTDFEHLFLSDFIGVDQGAAIQDCDSAMSVIASKAFYTADEQYAVYAKYTTDGDTISIGEVYGIADKDDNGYSSIRVRGDVVKEGDVYKITSSNNINYFVSLTQGEGVDDVVADVTETLAVSDSASQYTVYFEFTRSDAGLMTLTDIYGMAVKGQDGAFETVAIDGEISYNESTATYTVPTTNGTYAVKLIIENAGRNRFKVEVTKNNG
ncbi:MAG: hypothetical protein J1G01_01770 [Clostridiales bacterium]|nr:hypothetical protein [Clostridiales bacterium]